MTINKIGHCCLLITINDVVIMTDPGSFTEHENVQVGVQVVVITHEHGDHIHVPSLQAIYQHNPEVVVVCNESVGALLTPAGIPFVVLQGTDSMTIAGVYFEAYDAPHAEIFEDVGQVQNTGYFIGERLFYPGDAYGEPGKPVEVLALPVGGPWCRMTDTLHYALRINPKQAFPVHDGIERDDRISIQHSLAERILGEHSITFTPLLPGESHTY